MDLSDPEALQRIDAAIAAMPQQQRDAFLLHRLEFHGYDEIAKQLGIGIDTVEQHIAASLKALRLAVEP